MSMIKSYTFTAVVDEEDPSIIKLDEPFLVKRLLSKFKGKGIEVTLGKLYKNRTNAQNRYLWGVVYLTVVKWHKEMTGEDITMDEVHAHNLSVIQGAKPVVKILFGEEVITFEEFSTSKLNTVQFSAMVERIRYHYAKRGLYIPSPIKYGYLLDYIKADQEDYRDYEDKVQSLINQFESENHTN